MSTLKFRVNRGILKVPKLKLMGTLTGTVRSELAKKSSRAAVVAFNSSKKYKRALSLAALALFTKARSSSKISFSFRRRASNSSFAVRSTR